jgi:diadenosine tetraphosphate (Ap4A) HIT family hydrolase
VSCPFCRPDADRLVASNDHAFALRDGYPIAEGHTLVVPKRHTASVFDLPAEEQAAVWELVAKVRNRLRSELAPDGFNIGLNDGEAAGQTVLHAHVHVIPRRRGDVPDPRGGVRWVIPGRAVYWTDPS